MSIAKGKLTYWNDVLLKLVREHPFYFLFVTFFFYAGITSAVIDLRGCLISAPHFDLGYALCRYFPALGACVGVFIGLSIRLGRTRSCNESNDANNRTA